MRLEGFAILVVSPLPADAAWASGEPTSNLCGEAPSGGINSSAVVCKITTSWKSAASLKFRSISARSDGQQNGEACLTIPKYMNQ
jgi:hypothetical protein